MQITATNPTCTTRTRHDIPPVCNCNIQGSYQLMIQGGIPKDNIVVMHYDDIANSASNPQKGNVINRPDGPNNYVDVPKDYTGSNVTAANFLRALKGIAVPPQVSCPNEGYTAGQSCDEVILGDACHAWRVSSLACTYLTRTQGTTCCCTKRSFFKKHCEQYASNHSPTLFL